MNDDDGVLFECDFSIEELTVLADLLEIPALPGGDPDLELSQEVKAAAARGLLARGVVSADGPAGTVEITQPYATMIALVLAASEVAVVDSAVLLYRTAEAAVAVSNLAGGHCGWSVRGSSYDGGSPVVLARQAGTAVVIETSGVQVS